MFEVPEPKSSTPLEQSLNVYFLNVKLSAWLVDTLLKKGVLTNQEVMEGPVKEMAKLFKEILSREVPHD